MPEYVSVDSALLTAGIPPANHAFIHRILRSVDAEGVYVAGGHIVAVRPGRMSLNIARGSTNGFESEDAARAAAGADAFIEPSERGRGWRVVHPEDPGGVEAGPLAGRTPPRSYGPCPACGMPRSASGACTDLRCDLA